MTIKLTAASFLNGVRNSGLVDANPLDAVIRDMKAAGADANDSTAIAAELVKRDLVTSWQVDKLLQGRHKGFFLGRYRLLRLLGTGQMSAVYLGRHIYMDHLVAIKVLPADKVKDTSYLARFYREARAVASMNHPNIIRAFDVDKQVEAGTDIHFLVMEYIEGKPLTNHLTDVPGQKLDFVFVANIMRQAAEGLSHAHDINMVHRDIKPDNLLITPNGDVKILDLGLARFFKTTDEESLTLKHDERVIGTADYLAPEQAIDSHTVDSRADIYGLGCTFYFALTGHPPFTEGTLVQRLMAHQTHTPPPVTNDRPDAPDSLLAILNKMLAKKREERYQTGREAAADLTTWLVANASEDWKEKHLPMYAAIRLREMIAASAKSLPADVVATVTTPPVEKSPSEISDINKPSAVKAPTTGRPTTAKPGSGVTSKPTSTTRPVDAASAKVAALRTPRQTTNAPQMTATAAAVAVARSGENVMIQFAKKYPAATLVVGVVAVALLIAGSIAFLSGDDSASAKDHSQAPSEPSRTV